MVRSRQQCRSPAFQGRAHVDLEGPGFVLLPIKEGVALDDTLDIDHPVSARVGVRRAPAYLSPSTAPSTTTWPTWMPSGPYSFAIAWARIRRPALAELKAPYPARPRSEALAPVNRMVPCFRGTMRRGPPRPNRNPP